MTKKTCGPFYKAALEVYAGDDPEKVRIFAAGFVSGQAEKIYLGACRAAMFRPAHDRFQMILEVVRDVARRYDLLAVELTAEIWLCRDKQAAAALREMGARAKDSPGWHRLRGILCGIPNNEIDEAFHERAGYGERCD